MTRISGATWNGFTSAMVSFQPGVIWNGIREFPNNCLFLLLTAWENFPNVSGMSSLAIGNRIEATRPSDSFYSRVRGVIVEEIKNGFVKINADEVVSKWNTKWEKHPGAGCVVWVKLSDIVSK